MKKKIIIISLSVVALLVLVGYLISANYTSEKEAIKFCNGVAEKVALSAIQRADDERLRTGIDKSREIYAQVYDSSYESCIRDYGYVVK